MCLEDFMDDLYLGVEKKTVSYKMFGIKMV